MKESGRSSRPPEGARRGMASNVAPQAEGAPDERGRYGRFGGRFVPETLMAAIEDLEAGHLEARADPGFQGELHRR